MILFIVNAKKRSFLELLLSRVNLWEKFRSELKKMGANFAGRICISFDPLNCPQASNLELFFLILCKSANISGLYLYRTPKLNYLLKWNSRWDQKRSVLFLNKNLNHFNWNHFNSHEFRHRLNEKFSTHLETTILIFFFRRSNHSSIEFFAKLCSYFKARLAIVSCM